MAGVPLLNNSNGNSSNDVGDQHSRLHKFNWTSWLLQVRLLNSVAALRQLRAEGLTREMYVFGLVQVHSQL